MIEDTELSKGADRPVAHPELGEFGWDYMATEMPGVLRSTPLSPRFGEVDCRFCGQWKEGRAEAGGEECG